MLACIARGNSAGRYFPLLNYTAQLMSTLCCCPASMDLCYFSDEIADLDVQKSEIIIPTDTTAFLLKYSVGNVAHYEPLLNFIFKILCLNELLFFLKFSSSFRKWNTQFPNQFIFRQDKSHVNASSIKY